MGDGKQSPIQNLLPCVLCGRTDDCLEKYGEKKTYPENNLTLHYYCLLMSSGIWQRGEEDEGIDGFLFEDIRKEVSRSRKLCCSICRKKGASIGCVGKGCKRSYHFPCGVEKECVFQFMDTFKSYCWAHRPVQKCASRRSRGSSPCTICLDLVAHCPSYSILRSPCCKTTWFHRDCLQYQALSAGVFFFRCTVCNNKDQFQKEMLRLGIHIPEKDASWELEENAYQDLLQRYQHCDAQMCRCKGGREYDEPGSKWEIIRCECCGSSGTHLACSSMQIWEQSWECSGCRSISHQSGKRRRSRSLTASGRFDMVDRTLEHPSPKCSRRSSGSHRTLLLRPYSMQWRVVADILRELEFQVNALCTAKLTINRTEVWASTLKGFRHPNFSPTKTIKVQFSGDKRRLEVQEQRGSNREFFRLLNQCLQNSSLFEGVSSKNLSLDFEALQENLYYEAGRMIAVSLVHGGPSPGFFSKTLFHCLVYGPENVEPSTEDVSDEDVLQLIKRIKFSTSVVMLRATVQEFYEYLCDAGCLSIIETLRDKNTLVKDLLVYQVIRRVHSPFESFRNGLKTLGMLEKVQAFPDAFWSVLCQRPEKLTAITLGNLFTIHFSAEDNSTEVPETRIAEFWMDYLEDVEDGETVVSLEEILMFATGADGIPPIGFNPEPSIRFYPGDMPIGNPCTNCLELPTTNTYKEFKERMDRAVRHAQSSGEE